jgi:lipopolysaccharide/colanic/teichoic acid biosynthesis glycosyltransferase
MIHYLAGLLSSLSASMTLPKQDSIRTHSGAAGTLKDTPRCARPCQYGHCSLLAEPWFTRMLSLERKRTERSRIPFMLMLLGLERVGVNGDRDRLAHDILAALGSLIRETDLAGWHKDSSVLGVIFTDLGGAEDAAPLVRLILSKVIAALNQHLGTHTSNRISISCHIFPEDWRRENSGKSADEELYPDLSGPQNSKWLRSTGKRLLDLAGSMLALAMFSPLFLLIALAIKLTSKGPVLFEQVRIGQYGRQFMFLKFRSMQVSNDPQIHKEYVTRLIAGAQDSSPEGVYKIKDDPRVTRLGGFLRKTSLDELPQFWNVLLGDMSLVGPRPPLPYEVEVYDIWHRRRLLEAKPGITGLWQVNGRSHTRFDEMVRLDLQYTRLSSLWLDVSILLQTPRAVVLGDGAC